MGLDEREMYQGAESPVALPGVLSRPRLPPRAAGCYRRPTAEHEALWGAGQHREPGALRCLHSEDSALSDDKSHPSSRPVSVLRRPGQDTGHLRGWPEPRSAMFQICH